jgi:hypothetical protein
MFCFFHLCVLVCVHWDDTSHTRTARVSVCAFMCAHVCACVIDTSHTRTACACVRVHLCVCVCICNRH